jgi:hypothetical protein
MVSIIMRQWILFTLSPSFLSVSSSMRQHADIQGCVSCLFHSVSATRLAHCFSGGIVFCLWQVPGGRHNRG